MFDPSKNYKEELKKRRPFAEKLIKSKNFRWIDGMEAINIKTNENFRVIIAGDCYECSNGTAEWRNVHDSDDWIPNLADDGTIGILLALTRLVTKIPNAWTVERNGQWHICWSGATHGGDLGVGSTEVEAIVNALVSYE